MEPLTIVFIPPMEPRTIVDIPPMEPRTIINKQPKEPKNINKINRSFGLKSYLLLQKERIIPIYYVTSNVC